MQANKQNVADAQSAFSWRSGFCSGGVVAGQTCHRARLINSVTKQFGQANLIKSRNKKGNLLSEKYQVQFQFEELKMVFRTKILMRWLNFILIFCLVSQTLTPLLVLAEIPIATTKQVEASSRLTAPETQPPPPQPEIDFKQNPPFTPVQGLGVYLGLSDAVRVEVVEGSIISGLSNAVDIYGDGNDEWVTAQASDTAMWIEVEFDFNLPAGSQYTGVNVESKK